VNPERRRVFSAYFPTHLSDLPRNGNGRRIAHLNYLCRAGRAIRGIGQRRDLEVDETPMIFTGSRWSS